MIHLKRAMLEGITGPNPALVKLQQALQSAIELEHATIPVYLYALYSLDEHKNPEIAAIIESVVIEEMLHMVLSCNVLNAIGGAPVIDSPGFIPTYPGPLPGGVEAELTVSLAPFSMDQLQTFLTIEQPENPIDFKAMAEADTPITIGQFYDAISKAIGALGQGIFVPGPYHQVGPELMDEAVVVTDVATAQQAIQTIVEQGEGTSNSPLEIVGSGYAHYYRYMQIQKGHLLVPTSGGPDPADDYAYSGAPVPFDASGVYAVPTNPGPYAPGTIAAFANDNFNYTYTALLGAIHQLVNGDATTNQFNRALGLMMSLKGQAKAMMAGIPDPSVLTGPSFQYQPVNPAT
ncbi:MAG: ferritin-like protein [Sphingomonas sp.]|nr:ferritin-like protein [Sphingomonas sp.]